MDLVLMIGASLLGLKSVKGVSGEWAGLRASEELPKSGGSCSS